MGAAASWNCQPWASSGLWITAGAVCDCITELALMSCPFASFASLQTAQLFAALLPCQPLLLGPSTVCMPFKQSSQCQQQHDAITGGLCKPQSQVDIHTISTKWLIAQKHSYMTNLNNAISAACLVHNTMTASWLQSTILLVGNHIRTNTMLTARALLRMRGSQLNNQGEPHKV